jgi:hypothetical protein
MAETRTAMARGCQICYTRWAEDGVGENGVAFWPCVLELKCRSQCSECDSQLGLHITDDGRLCAVQVIHEPECTSRLAVLSRRYPDWVMPLIGLQRNTN